MGRRNCLLALLALLSACTPPAQPGVARRAALGAMPETMTLTLPPAVLGGARYHRFLAGYRDRGHGRLWVAGATNVASDAMRRRLVADGISAGAIRVANAGTVVPGTITLRYRRYDVILPVCGDWRAVTAYNPGNTDYPGFGCALERDVGLMLADPGNLVAMRAPAPADAANLERVIDAYRSGRATAAIAGPIQDGADQNVATGATSATSSPTLAPAAAP